MKILPIDKVREADAYTIDNEPISSIDLMERAAKQLVNWISKHIQTSRMVHIFCGLGNNGGDGLAVGRLLAEQGYRVHLYPVRTTDHTSADFQHNLDRLPSDTNTKVVDIESEANFPLLQEEDVIIDALFGSGLTRTVSGLAAKLISYINSSIAVTISIDIPSGLFADQPSSAKNAAIIKADYTLSLQFPKLAFMFPENDVYVGQWEVLDIGLHADYINKANTKDFYMCAADIAPMLSPRKKFSHKGSYGHALLIAGGYGKMGAAVLASRACLRTGVGLLHTHIPNSGIQLMQTSSPETMLSLDRYENYFSEVPGLSPYTAVGVGPGIGMEHQSQMALKLLIQECSIPMVFDADALNILAENKTWLAFLPPNSILTPHPKEFERLAGSWSNDFERLQLQRNMAVKHGLYVVLKGAHTSICFPDGRCFFNSTGNPGMATAGSGDVLTGMITALLAQAYSPGRAAVLGVFIHGLAGDLAIKKTGMQALIASDIIDHIGAAFKLIVPPSALF